ncbi:MAG: Uncharacterized protein FD157_2902 [Rhodocyclaceae bacterium]|nr:MAG: Uncharacterized protein FD157_2902 [Rhodocyclaceae bacterium]TND03847.1 MAG: Uncharacterized protein FD118_1265 [Rhodocyclaceae bacterium]
MKIPTEALGLAGEYAVAADLCRRGVYCQLTLGNRKKTDILVVAKDQVFKVSVKSKQGGSWARVTGIWEDGDLLVFVDYAGKDKAEPPASPDFYVLDVSAWKKLVARKSKDDPRAKIDAENTLVWAASPGKKNGWRGCEILVKEVEKFKNKWPDFKPD